MKKSLYISAVAAMMSMIITSCGNKELPVLADSNNMRFEALHPARLSTSRTSDAGFINNDQIGIFVATSTAELEASGNWANNVKATYNGSVWNTEKTVKWGPDTYNVYAYYPYSSTIPSVDDYPFAVQHDQSSAEGYAQSDFLWALAKDQVASNEPVQLQFAHRMSRVVLTLGRSSDYGDDVALPDEAEVYIHNTIPEGTVDLAAGYATKSGTASPTIIKAKSLGNYQFAAIIYPQRIDTPKPLFEVIANGVSYLYEARFVFKTGVQHNVTLQLSKNPDQIRIDLGGEIEGWTE